MSTQTTEIALTEAQRRALAEHLKQKRASEILVTAVIVFLIVMVIGTGVRRSAPPILALLLVVVAVALVFVAALAAYRKFRFDARATQVVKRTAGDLTIETIYNDEGPDVRFIEVDGRKVVVDKDVPDMRVGTIEYTPHRGHLVAIWDRDGILGWAAPGYEPFSPDRMRISA